MTDQITRAEREAIERFIADGGEVQRIEDRRTNGADGRDVAAVGYAAAWAEFPLRKPVRVGCNFARAPSVSGKRDIGINELLQWAFASECASLDPPGDFGARGYGYASMTSAVIMHEKLGCRVDGGGTSAPHPDADVVAAQLAVLSDARGGWHMATRIAELARQKAVPRWDMGEVEVFPLMTRTGRGGCLSRVADASNLGDQGWPAQPRRNRKGVIVHDVVEVCPVGIRPTAGEIARARRFYLDWWGALRDLRDALQCGDPMTAWRVTDDMPPMTPWDKTS